jgi:hypothetical protein
VHLSALPCLWPQHTAHRLSHSGIMLTTHRIMHYQSPTPSTIYHVPCQLLSLPLTWGPWQLFTSWACSLPRLASLPGCTFLATATIMTSSNTGNGADRMEGGCPFYVGRGPTVPHLCLALPPNACLFPLGCCVFCCLLHWQTQCPLLLEAFLATFSHGLVKPSPGPLQLARVPLS